MVECFSWIYKALDKAASATGITRLTVQLFPLCNLVSRHLKLSTVPQTRHALLYIHVFLLCSLYLKCPSVLFKTWLNITKALFDHYFSPRGFNHSLPYTHILCLYSLSAQITLYVSSPPPPLTSHTFSVCASHCTMP